jgi:MFS family permease
VGRDGKGGGLILRLEEIAAIPPEIPPIKSQQLVLSTHAVIALIGSMLLVGTSFGAVAPLVSAILENRGFSEYFTGGVTAILAAGIAISSTYVGRLVDRYGTRRINALGIIGQAFGFAGLGVALATEEVLLFPVRFELGVAATMTFIAAEVALLRGVPERIRGRVMAAYGSALGVGFMLGVFGSDIAYEAMGLWCFALVAAIGIGIALIAYRGLRGEVGDPLAPTKSNSIATPFATEAKFDWRPLWIALYGAVIFGSLDTAISGTYPVEGQRLGLSRSESLHIVGLMAFGLVMGQPLAGWLADKLGVRRVLGSLAVFGVVSSIAAGFASRLIIAGNRTWAAVMFTLIGIAVGGTYPISLKIMGDRTPPEKLPRVNARFSGTYGYASLAGPIISAFGIDVMESFGYLGWAVPGLAGLTLALLLPLVRWDRRFGSS